MTTTIVSRPEFPSVRTAMRVNEPGVFERWYAVLVMFVLAYRLPIEWFTIGTTKPGGTIIPLIYTALFAVCFGPLLGNMAHVGRALRREPLVPVFVGLIVLSLLWSADVAETVKDSVSFAFATAFAYYLVVRYVLPDILRLAARAVAIGTFFNYLWIVAFPQYSRTPDPQNPAIVTVRGVTVFKNGLGAIAVLGLIIVWYRLRLDRRNRPIWFAVLVLNFGLLVLSQSKTSLAAAIVLAVFVMVVRGVKARSTAFGAVVLATLAPLVVGSYLLATNLANVAALFGKDATLTGRTQLWRDTLHEIGKRPWFGAGWGAFWRGWFSPSHDIWLGNAWQPPTAHNGLLQILTELGIVGAVVLLVLYARGLVRSTRYARVNADTTAQFPLIIIVNALLFSVTEAGDVNRSLAWVLMVVAFVTASGRSRFVAVAPVPAPRRAASARRDTLTISATSASGLTTANAADTTSAPASDAVRPPVVLSVATADRIASSMVHLRVASRWGEEPDDEVSDLDAAAGAAILAETGSGTVGRALAKNASWQFVAEIATLGAQTIIFLIVARAFGPSVYGLYTTTTGIALMAAALSTVGAQFVLMRTASTGRDDLSTAAGRAYVTALGGGVVVTLGLLALQRLLLPDISWSVFGLLVAAELVFTQPANVTRFAAQAAERLDLVPRLVALTYGLRLVSVIAYFGLVSSPSLATWSRLYFAVAALSCIATMGVGGRLLGLRFAPQLPSVQHLKQGIVFSFSLSAALVKNDVDKPLLTRLGSADATGLYTSAYRFIGMLTLPAKALADASFARFFREGERGPREATMFARKLALTATAITATGGILAFALAPVVEVLLGSKYHETVTIIRWLVFIPVLLAWQQYAFYGLVSLGRERQCVLATLLTSLINVGVNVALIPHHSWRGCAVATLVSESFLALLLWSLLMRRVRQAEETAEAFRVFR